MRRQHALCLLLCVVLALLFWPRASKEQTTLVVDRICPTIALLVSGAARDEQTLRTFAAALRQHVIEPHAAGCTSGGVWLYAWLESSELEALFESLFPEVRTLTRRAMRSRLPDALRRDEQAALALEHAALLRLHNDTTTLNTLRMLRKLRGVEWLRASQKCGSDPRARSDSRERCYLHEHDLVLRIRPDLVLTSPLRLRRLPAGGVQLPWSCTSQRLVFDQLFLSGADVAAHVGTLYERAAQLAAAARRQLQTTEQAGLYPEALLMEHLAAGGWEMDAMACDVCPATSADGCTCLGDAALFDAQRGRRDPFAKLRRDFPRCSFPPAVV